MEKSNEEIGKIFKALGDSNRLKILDLIKMEEKCACKLLEELKIGQSTLSHNMKILCDSKIVNCRKDGKWSHYSLNKEIYRELESILKDIFTK